MRTRRLVGPVLGALAVAGGCGDAPHAPDALVAPDAAVGADAAAPPCGPYDDACGPAVGVPPSGCGDGFAADGDGGCTAVLPASPCPSGSLAWPGEAACHDVAPCDGGRWGDAPDEPTTQYVDSASTGTADGTQAHPWTTLADAFAAAAPGAVVALAAGSYHGANASVPLRVWGRCPALVEIFGADGATTLSYESSDDAGALPFEVHDVAVRSDGSVIGAIGATRIEVVVDRVWLHGGGAAVRATNGHVTVRRSLVEGTGGGIYAANAAIDRTVLRDVVDQVAEQDGPAAVYAYDGSGVYVHQVLVERWTAPALVLLESAVVDSVLVRDLRYRRAGAAVTIGAGADPDAKTVVQRSVVQRAIGEAVDAVAIPLVVADTVIDDTQAFPDGTRGTALDVATDIERSAASLVVRASRFASNATAALISDTADVDVDGLLVRGTRAQAADGAFGRGIDLYAASARIRSTRIEASHEIGLLATDVALDVADLVVTDTASNGASRLADGVVAQGGAAVHLARVRVARSGRAGITSFGVTIGVAGATLVDDAIDLDGETVGPAGYVFDDGGGNACFAAGVARPCLVLTSGLAPPSAVGRH